ncbi:TSC22 domain family protein 1-like isoform X1 [Thalassophryne amazonica]|uniref:TSC22 domain family protein 1-like isoform X1 n=1 Tax=Thalassophryne amazonica TaxID=390379 RepID=UPI001470C6E3|nr:TSC22 domain family protein 1-like isoform X1 [Thalassophryne amazonica]
MHHPDPAGESGSVRKMAHPAVFHRRGSNPGTGSGSTLSTPANSVISNSHVQTDDYQSSLVIQCQPPGGSPSPASSHPPPHSLNLQPQPTQSAGAQMKKKSGFQITSVTPAQISVSTNNSIAEDTESYDDLDESHTEDLSSSEILDVSLSRANDIVGAERSSSEETLNNFHDAETPGAVSPNQPSHPHSMSQAPQHGGTMVNGIMHHHPEQHHQPQVYRAPSGPGNASSVVTSGALSYITQKMPSNVGALSENVAQAAPPSNNIAQPVGIVVPASVPGMHSSVAGTNVNIANPQTSSVSNVNILSSANVPVRGGITTSASSSSGGFPVSVISSNVGSVGENSAVAGMGNPVAHPNVATIQQHQNINVNITMATTATVAVASASVAMGVSGGIQGRVGSALLQTVNAPVTAVAMAPVPSTWAQPAPAPAPAVATTSSRFRVVKLDSSSEHFKKGRWTCTEYYDKETPASAPSSSASESTCFSMRPMVPESLAGASERESTGGSSVSSTISTLSHYSESVCSGDAGGPTVNQHVQDYASPPQGFQAVLPTGMGVSHIQPHMHPQDVTSAHVKTTAAPSGPAAIHHPVPMSSHQTTIGLLTPAVHQQQLTYAQAVANQPPGSTQGALGVQQQKMGYSNMPQHPPATLQAAPLQVRQSDYTQPHQTLLQPGASQAVANQSGSAPSGPGNGVCQMMGGPQQSQPSMHTQPQHTASLQGTSSTMTSNVGSGGLGQQPQSHLDRQQQKPQTLPTQIQNPTLGTHLPNVVHQSQGTAANVAPPNLQNDPQAHTVVNSGRMPPQALPQNQTACVGLSQDHTSAQAAAHAAQTTALYASLPTFTTTQLEDAQRLLLQHQSALLGLPKLSGGEDGSASSAGQVPEAATISALPASAGLLKAVDGDEDSSSGASVVAIDNKIEQAMDLVKSHLMYAVREEVEVLKEQIKELIERNSQLEQENTLLKTLASPEQMAQFQAQVQTGSPPAAPTAPTSAPPSTVAQPTSHSSGPSA